MSEEIQYDSIIIGAGQAASPLAQALAGAGWRVALIEKAHVGGTCVNTGCTPTKTMVSSARSAYAARRASAFGISAGPVNVDMNAIRERKRSIVESFRAGSLRRIEETDGIDLIRGTGRFLDRNRIEVISESDRSTIRSETVFINTGLTPRTPALAGLETVPYLDSTSIMELDIVPKHLLVLGGGYIGVEFAQMFRRFGSNVTIVHRSSQLLRHEDEDVAAEVAAILREDGVDILLDSEPRRVSPTAGKGIELTLSDGTAIVGSHLLVAVGRVPDTSELNLNAAGVETNGRGFIEVNDRLETSAEGVYALGDIKGGPAFTHISYDDYRVVRENLLGDGHASTGDRLVPYTVFMDPQLGGIGLTERDADRQGREVRIAKMPMAYVARAIESDESRGLMKVLVDPKTDLILGAAVLGMEGGELMSIIQTAMMGRLPYTALRDAVFTHPSLAESLNNLFATLG